MDNQCFTIRAIDKKEDFTECENIQKTISPLNEVGVVPGYMMEIAARHGGITIGTYEQEKLIGFSFAFPAYTRKNGYYLFSDTMGLYPPYQKRSLGFAMKQEQCRQAIEKGAKKIVWTFDPLLGQNANLNIRKLGGIVNRYDIEKYNEVSTSTGVNIPADRFYLQWQIYSERVKKRVFQLEVPKMRYRKQINFTSITKTHLVKKQIMQYGIQKEANYRDLVEVKLDLDLPSLVVEIPFEYKQIKTEFPIVARNWRLQTRSIFDRYINQKGYRVYEFFQLIDGIEIRNYYLLHAPSHQENQTNEMISGMNQAVQ